MKKLLLPLLSLLCLTLSMQAQDTFDRGSSIINFGVGISDDNFNKTVLPPLSVSYDHSVADGLLDGKASIGIGGYFAMRVLHHKHHQSSDAYFTLGPRATFHYQFVDKLDTYIAPMLSYNLRPYYDEDDEHIIRRTAGNLSLGLHLGSRYYLTPQWAIMGEIGTSFSYLTLGATYLF